MNLSLSALPYESIYYHNGKELHHSIFNLDWLLGETPEVILDVGAWDFGDSVRFKVKYPSARVFAFELLKSNYEKHSEFAKSCGVQCFNEAVADKVGEIEFYEGTHVHGDNAQSSILEPAHGYTSMYGNIVQHKKSETTIKSTTIDFFCKSYGIDKIDVLHLDVEGAEYQVLSGIGEVKPRLIFAEFLIDGGWTGQKSFKETLDMLDGFGYNVVKNLGSDKLFQLRD